MTRSKVYTMLLSIVIAFGLWLYVVSNVSQETEETFYNIDVVMDAEAVLADRNLMITSVSTKTVSLKLSGTRSDLSKVNSDNITVKTDLSKVYEPGENIPLTYNIYFPGDVPQNAFVVESKNPTYIYVSVDTRRTKEIPVQIKWTGTRSGDYLYDTENAVLDYSAITITGPAKVADQIEFAYIEVDLTDRVESLSESYRYTLCDAEGNPVDAQQITTSVDQVRVDLKVQRMKEIRLVAKVIYGGGATELNTTVEVEPKVIRLTGSDAVLAELGDEYTVCTVNLAEVEKSQDLKYTITLPEGVTNQTGVSEATVTVRFTGLSTREFVVDNIQMTNVPEGLAAEIINANLTVRVRGPMLEINRLTAEDITIVVDMSSAEIGTATYKATVLFADNFPNVGAVRSYSVSVMVQEAEEE